MVGLKDLFGKNDYAKEFKEAFEKQDSDKIMDVLTRWNDSNIDDANFGLAMVIMGSLDDNIPSSETFKLYLSSINEDCDNQELFGWFNNKAIEFMEMKVDDEIGFSEMFNNKYKSNNSSNNYAKLFLGGFENFLDDGNFDDSKIVEMKDIVDLWENDYPEDANMHCAFVILNIANISSEQLNDRIKKANDYVPADKNLYPKFLALMYGVCQAKED